MQDLNAFQDQMKRGTVRGSWEKPAEKKRASPDGDEEANGRTTKKQKVDTAKAVRKKIVEPVTSESEEEIPVVQPTR